MDNKIEKDIKRPLPNLGKAEGIRENKSWNVLRDGLINPESVIGRAARGKDIVAPESRLKRSVPRNTSRK